MLRDLERETGERTPDILARAVDQFYRSLLIAETNIGYAELHADPVAGAEEAAEQALWDHTAADGLDD